jgi:hypothetical protein
VTGLGEGSDVNLSLNEAADELGIECWRLARLGRLLKIWSGEKRLPREAILHIKEKETAEERYRALLSWLLDDARSTRSR